MTLNFAERLGRKGGELLAPFTHGVSRARGARMFHPDGVLYGARMEAIDEDPRFAALGRRLTGPTLLRFSSALWRQGRDWPDVLGVALRLPDSAETGQGQQDLLLATIRFPWTTLLAPLATNFRSFLWNHYHAVSPFEAEGVGRVKLRLRSPRLDNSSELSRAEHLQRAVEQGQATLELQLRRLDLPPWSRSWQTVARVCIEAPLVLDQAALRFSPFNAGRGLRPVGFVHALRWGAYAASQRGRPASEGEGTHGPPNDSRGRSLAPSPAEQREPSQTEPGRL